MSEDKIIKEETQTFATEQTDSDKLVQFDKVITHLTEQRDLHPQIMVGCLVTRTPNPADTDYQFHVYAVGNPVDIIRAYSKLGETLKKQLEKIMDDTIAAQTQVKH